MSGCGYWGAQLKPKCIFEKPMIRNSVVLRIFLQRADILKIKEKRGREASVTPTIATLGNSNTRIQFPRSLSF